MDNDIHISASQLKTYAGCSLKWLYSRKYEPEFVSLCLVFGRSWHAAVELFYQYRLEGKVAAHDEMLEVFKATWADEDKPVYYGKNEDESSLHERAADMLQVFLDNVAPGEVVAIEEKVTCSIGEGIPELLGYIDLVEIRDDKLHLVDFKTAARKPSDGPDADQLLLYSIAAKKTGILKSFNLPLVLRYDYVTKTKKPEFCSYTIPPLQRDTERLIAKARECWRGMSSEIAYPNPSWMCAGCGYKSKCGEWPSTSIDLITKE